MRRVRSFTFAMAAMELQIPVTRAEFEGWIAEELRAIEGSVDSLLESSGVERA